MTSVVLLRQWKDTDLEPCVAMNADPEVMRFFPSTATAEQTKSAIERRRLEIDRQGWGMWAVEVEDEFAGFTGLMTPSFEAFFTPCIEIGWRFRRKFWGRGLACAAARQAEDFAFERLGLTALVSYTAAGNARSRRLMERLGFTRDPNEDFLHPLLPVDHPLRPHVLYRKTSGERQMVSGDR